MGTRPAVLVVAGVDSSGGAGLTRDARVLANFGVDVLCAVTAVTAQSSSCVNALHHVPPQLVRAQIAAALDNHPVGAIKIGMLGTSATVGAVVDSLPAREVIPIVLDPVLLASSGGVLLDAAGREAMLERLFPRVTLVTPNIPEAAALLGERPADNERALLAQAQGILALGPQAVLLKGGHAQGEEAVDWLLEGSSPARRLASPRLPGARRGTGCALASGIAAGLASGEGLATACQRAKAYVSGLFQQTG